MLVPMGFALGTYQTGYWFYIIDLPMLLLRIYYRYAHNVYDYIWILLILYGNKVLFSISGGFFKGILLNLL